jgi:hypothetical protein
MSAAIERTCSYPVIERLGGFYRAEEELEHKAFMATYPRPITKETTHETYYDCIGYRVCAFEHFRTCTSGRRYGWRKLHVRRLRSYRFHAWLVLERQHDRNWRRFKNRSE